MQRQRDRDGKRQTHFDLFDLITKANFIITLINVWFVYVLVLPCLCVILAIMTNMHMWNLIESFIFVNCCVSSGTPH